MHYWSNSKQNTQFFRRSPLNINKNTLVFFNIHAVVCLFYLKKNNYQVVSQCVVFKRFDLNSLTSNRKHQPASMKKYQTNIILAADFWFPVFTFSRAGEIIKLECKSWNIKHEMWPDWLALSGPDAVLLESESTV